MSRHLKFPALSPTGKPRHGRHLWLFFREQQQNSVYVDFPATDSCAVGRTMCGAGCVDTFSHHRTAASAAMLAPTTKPAWAAHCTATCSKDLTLCGDLCVNLKTTAQTLRRLWHVLSQRSGMLKRRLHDGLFPAALLSRRCSPTKAPARLA